MLRAEVPVERTKVALLAVIAAALCSIVARDWMPEAHAQSADIACNAWYKEMIGGLKGEEKVLAMSMEYAGSVRDWLLQHPGDPVFRTTLVQGQGLAYIDIMCVR
jgi:hypothetical protein